MDALLPGGMGSAGVDEARHVKEAIPMEQPNVVVWWYSVLVKMTKDYKLFREFVIYVRKNRHAFSLNTQFFLCYQFVSLHFNFSELDDDLAREEMWLFYKDISDDFAKKMTTSLDPIPYEERNRDFVLVITGQFLEIQHGPTKTALDRCKVLIEHMNKEVLLLNTAEVGSKVGYIPFLEAATGNYCPEKMQESKQDWKGTAIPYYQCVDNMPNIKELDRLLQVIREAAPGRVVSIGACSILADLVNKMIPVVMVGLAPSNLGNTTTDYQTLSRKLTEEDRNMLERVGYTEKHVIESIFTSSLKPQTEKITRKELGVPEEKFLMIVVGARLDEDVTDEFLNMLNQIIQPDMHIGFLGNFMKFEERMRKFQPLYEHVSNLGFCADILSRMEVCDLYVNPTRKGGGTSCVEAMFKGIPVVSVSYGDVYINVGEEFCVKDYNEMQEKILQYYTDKNYYKIMSDKALERVHVLLDTETEFKRIMHEVDSREQGENI